jgi:nicotinamidase/pyrazinamidase
MMIFFDVDTQRDFMEIGGALYVPGAETIRPNIERLLRAAGERKITTISSLCAHVPDDPEFEIFPPHCIDGTPGAERIFGHLPHLPRYERGVDADADPEAQLAPATHYIFKKRVIDLFANAWLEGLRQNGVFKGRDCIVFGVATDYCVRSCALGLARGGARVLLVEDAIQGVAEETTGRALAEKRAAGVEFTTTDEVLKRISDLRKGVGGRGSGVGGSG